MSNLQPSQSFLVANLIGQSVVMLGNVIALETGKGEFGVLLDAPANNLEVTITNASGALVNTLRLLNLPGGISSFLWDGKTASGETVTDGECTFTVIAYSGSARITSFPLSVGLVESVSTGSPGSHGAVLNIPTLGPVSFENVLQIARNEALTGNNFPAR